MKKTLMAGILTVMLLSTTGCGKTLKCTGKLYGMEASITTKFSKDKTKSAKMEYKLDVKEYLNLEKDPTEDQINDLVDSLKEQYEKDDEYDDIKVTSKGNVITIAGYYDIEEDEATTYDETKEQFEKMGLTCK